LEKSLKERFLGLLQETDIPIDVNYVAHALGVHWFTAYRMVTEIILAELQKHPEMTRNFPYLLLKSTKSLVIIPNKLLQSRDIRLDYEEGHKKDDGQKQK